MERESVRWMYPSMPSPGPDATAFMPCLARWAMCFCNRVGWIAEPTKEVEGDWGGVMFMLGTGGEGMPAKGVRVAEELD